MNHTSNPVIIGWSHHNTYSMIRCFGENGIMPDVILCGGNDSYILLSKYVNNIYVVSNAESALRLLKEKYDEAVVITCADDIASLMDKEYDCLIQRFVFFNCGSPGLLTHYMDKVVQSVMASQVGLKVPTSIETKPTEVKPSELPYPCIIKPLESIHGGKNIRICKNDSEVSTALDSFDKESRVVVQQYIEKDYEIVVVGLSCDNAIHIPAYIHKHRDTKGGTTYSTVKPITDLPTDLVASCRLLVERMSYKGLFGIELIRKGDDFVFIEINLRNDATTYAIAIAGCNLPLAFWELENGFSAYGILSNPVCQIDSMVEFNDFIHVLKRHVSFSTWIRQYRGAVCKYGYSKKDKRPFRKQKIDFVKFLLKMIYSHGIARQI